MVQGSPVCCGLFRVYGIAATAKATFQIQKSVINYHAKNMIYGGADMSEREYEALRSALASTRMEGFVITEQTEKDCVRLMRGELSVADLVKEILARPAKAV